MPAYDSPVQATGAEATGEVLLAVAVLRQAWQDAQSPVRAIRAEARAFWHSRSVHFWSEIVDVDAAVLAQAVLRQLQHLDGRPPGIPHGAF